MKINEINFFKELDRVKVSLCGQCWNKDDGLENIRDSVLLTQENMQHVLNHEIVQNVAYDYIRL